ncbi:hypothetical protein UVI_02042980 [Ustilaginoidea virens]|uniref:Uncharacterized protein n=1 Tax=Ustilaginoidea virens TaxID=1159556 RepID=A0A1B5L3P8_USTVR|nr:hypothetical protein UVI_02042980 [Ustilaginoidea virens]
MPYNANAIPPRREPTGQTQLPPNAVSHQDHLEFLEDIVPKTAPYKKVKAAAETTQARLRGGKVPEPVQQDYTQTAMDRSGGLIVNGASSASMVPLRTNDRREDPSEQLRLAMRRANGSERDGDITMAG